MAVPPPRNENPFYRSYFRQLLTKTTSTNESNAACMVEADSLRFESQDVAPMFPRCRSMAPVLPSLPTYVDDIAPEIERKMLLRSRLKGSVVKLDQFGFPYSGAPFYVLQTPNQAPHHHPTFRHPNSRRDYSLDQSSYLYYIYIMHTAP